MDGENGYPEWTPDGRRVAFYSTRDDEQDLYWKPVDGSTPAEPLFPIPGTENEVTFSRDGRWIVYRTGDLAFGEDTDLNYFDVRSGEHRPFLHTEFQELSPRLSPDGRWVAYVSNESGVNEVYARAFPGPGAVWQISSGGEAEPLWAHSGREFFYVSQEGLGSVDVRTTPEFSMGERRVLFRTDPYLLWSFHTSYDVTPDDETFVFMKAGTDEAIVVVFNWFEELKTRLASGD